MIMLMTSVLDDLIVYVIKAAGCCALLKKCGRRPWLGLIPAVCDYEIAVAVEKEEEGRIYFILSALGDPASWLDAGVTVLSAVATWWLAKSIPQQWILWIVADFSSAYLCFSQGMNWMTVLYVFYALSAIYGYYHWKKQGRYV